MLPVHIQLRVVAKYPMLVERYPPIGSKVGRDVRPICDASVEFDHSRLLALPGTHGIGKRILEPGDHLLRWGATSLPRYCHFTTPDELRDLLPAGETERVDEFTADGKAGDLNRYVVLRRRSDRDE